MDADAGASAKNILLVEDDPAVRQAIKMLLAVDRHAVSEAASGREAIRLFAGANYDLVITDYLMPEMLGDELARTLKHLAPAQPILMVTAYTDRLTNAGKPADVILPKPVGLEALREAIAQRIRRSPSPLVTRAGPSPAGSGSALAGRASSSGDPPEAEITPRDAREHVDSETLASWIQQEVEFLNVGASPSNPENSSAAGILRLLTFAYACNVLASDRVAAACELDPAFRSLCHGPPPFTSEIAAFRRRHRRQLELALARTLARIANRRARQPLACIEPALLEVARQRLDTSRHLDLWI